MNKIFTLIAVPFALFAFEVSFSKKFEQQVTPDKLSTNIIITTNKPKEVDISRQLERFNNFISRNETVEKKAGEFSIRPKHRYDKGQSMLIGFTGNLRYTIYSEESKDMNKFIKKLLKLKNDKDMSISIAGLNWIVSADKYAISVEKLRLEAILWGKKYADKLSTETNDDCNVQNINITSHSYAPIHKMARAQTMMLDSVAESNIPIPQDSTNEVFINPTYVLECK